MFKSEVIGMSNSKVPLVLVLSITLTSGVSSQSPAQSVPENDPNVAITNVELPKGTSTSPFAFVLGDGTIWFHYKDQVFKFDQQSGQFASIPVEQVKNVALTAFAVGGGSIWLFGKAHGVEGVHRIDPATGKCIASVVQARRGLEALTYGEGALWVLSMFDGSLQRMDPKTDQLSPTVIALEKRHWQSLAFAEGFVWVLDSHSGILKRIDPESMKVVDEFHVGPPQAGFLKEPFEGGGYDFTVGEGAVWVTNGKINGTNVLARFDAKTLDPVAKLESDATGGVPVVWNGYLWQAVKGSTKKGHLIRKISLNTNHVSGQVSLPAEDERFYGSQPPWLFTDGHSLWAVSQGKGYISRIQMRSAEPTDPQQ